MTNQPGVFVAGDMGRGQSLIVWAIAEGRAGCRWSGRIPHGRDAVAGADPTDRPTVDVTARVTTTHREGRP